MSVIPVIAIIDVGKTNKKILLFDERYKVRYEKSVHLNETTDEDGFLCDDITALTQWLKDSIAEVLALPDFDIKALNFSGYGASFVYLGASGKLVAPLYNYLKPYPENLLKKFYETYGGETNFSRTTASPVLGNLNSGMQLYRLKYEKPSLFHSIKFSLHLPQYLSSLLTGQYYSDITSLGCHTNLWDFEKNTYHAWVGEEGVEKILAPITNSDKIELVDIGRKQIPVGIGLHDSSAALIPYQTTFQQPFNLLSTGTWCINLNPFNASLLTEDQLKQDCLCYLSYEGKPVKASRLFAGYEHEQQTKRLAAHFHVSEDYYKSIRFHKDFIEKAQQLERTSMEDLNLFHDYESAYYQLMQHIMVQQVHSTQLVLKGTNVKQIFVDGGFSTNSIYMNLLASSFPDMKVFAATVPQASALGAALAIHKHWNAESVPYDLVELKLFESLDSTISE